MINTVAKTLPKILPDWIGNMLIESFYLDIYKTRRTEQRYDLFKQKSSIQKKFV